MITLTICLVVSAIVGICLVTFYGLWAYFSVKTKELELKQPANVGASKEELEAVIRRIAKAEEKHDAEIDRLEKKLAPFITLVGNKQIFRR